MGSLFSSPGKQASSAAQASGQIADQELSKLLNYTDTHQQELRDAIGKQGPNPYFGAAQELNPQAYYTDPTNTTHFSAGGGGSGLTPGQAQVQGNPFAPPPNIIQPGAGAPPPPVTPPSQPTQPGPGVPVPGGPPRQIPRFPIRIPPREEA